MRWTEPFQIPLQFMKKIYFKPMKCTRVIQKNVFFSKQFLRPLSVISLLECVNRRVFMMFFADRRRFRGLALQIAFLLRFKHLTEVFDLLARAF